MVVGHSMGAVLAGLWVARNPQRVAGLALVAAPFPADRPGDGGSGGRRSGFDPDNLGTGPRRAFRAAQLLWPVLSVPVRSRTFPRAVVSDYLRHTPASYWGSARNLLWDGAATTELEGLRHLSAPALVVSGDGDRRVPPADAERWAGLLPGAGRQVVEGGHQLLLRTGFRSLNEWLGALPPA